ncbi:MAG: hypothetical protein JRN20_13610 [Nitrososphaerota archaeon]|nr:hypothetical protein [Nitrososphaerota archaeon]MDG6921714.1 hypothetical protein [Nitrososphaerota archaeon]
MSCGPAFSASTSTFPTRAIAISVVGFAQYNGSITSSAGRALQYSTYPTVAPNQDIIGNELSSSINRFGDSYCGTLCSYVYAGQLVSNYRVTVTCNCVFEITSVQNINLISQLSVKPATHTAPQAQVAGMSHYRFHKRPTGLSHYPTRCSSPLGLHIRAPSLAQSNVSQAGWVSALDLNLARGIGRTPERIRCLTQSHYQVGQTEGHPAKFHLITKIFTLQSLLDH